MMPLGHLSFLLRLVGEERLHDVGVTVDYREEPLLFHTFQSLHS